MAESRGDAGVGDESLDAGAGSVALAPDASSASATPDASNPPDSPEIPRLLSQTGLFEADMVTLAPGVRPYEPRFGLWSDGASKRRWVFLPEGAQIDTSNMEYWSYPAGTRLYKEFSVSGVRVETRLLHRQANGSWWFMSYQWRADQSEADAVPSGVVNASGTQHDIPSTEDCRTCHLRMPDKALGFSAIQLSHEVEPPNENEWSLARLQAAGKLTQAPPAISIFPEDQLAREVLGFLHANCGHCHQPRSSVSSRVSLQLWLRTDALGSVQETPMYLSTVGQNVSLSLPGPEGDAIRAIVQPGSPEQSALFLRASSRGREYSMPPLSTKQADPVLTEFLRQWIESLAAPPPGEGDGDDGNGVDGDGSDDGDGSEDDGSGDDGDGSEDDGSEDDSGEDDGSDDGSDDGAEDDGSGDDGSE